MTETTNYVELHTWNRDFSWRSATGPFRLLTHEQAAHFDQYGFLVIEDVVDLDQLAVAEAEIDRFEEETESFLRQQKGGRAAISEAGAITFTTHLVARSAVLNALSRATVFLDLCADLVGQDASLYWDQAVYKKPEKPRPFPWHQDNGYAFVRPQQYLTCWVPLVDATVENGCPWVAPGYHRMGTLRHEYVHPLGFQCLEDPPGATPSPVRRGGVVVFSSLTPHLTGPNVTAGVRKAYILQYAPTGAVVLQGDATAGDPTAEVPADSPERQYPVLVGGQPAVPA